MLGTDWLQRSIYMLALRLAHWRPVSGSIYTSLPEALNNDAFIVRLINKADGKKFLVHKLIPQGAEDLYFNVGHAEGYPSVVPTVQLQHFHFEVTHYYHGHQLVTTWPSRFILNCIVNHSAFFAWREKVAQKRFNRLTLARKDRVEVLQLFQTETIKQHGFHISEIALLEILYTRRSFRHPDEQSTRAYYKLILESLADSGDLKAQQHNQYKLQPKGLSTLATYELEERRHRDNITQQRRMITVTAIVIAVGIVQAAASYFGAR
ncbi:hypothetical protein NKJ09_22060 [Mesorhizobium sp. M0189]|uniref:hypothetical protein n=1 Tax=unclassified Mesorhizobium TaxID=325217 RepID=UPI0033353594